MISADSRSNPGSAACFVYPVANLWMASKWSSSSSGKKGRPLEKKRIFRPDNKQITAMKTWARVNSSEGLPGMAGLSHGASDAGGAGTIGVIPHSPAALAGGPRSAFYKLREHLFGIDGDEGAAAARQDFVFFVHDFGGIDVNAALDADFPALDVQWLVQRDGREIFDRHFFGQGHDVVEFVH